MISTPQHSKCLICGNSEFEEIASLDRDGQALRTVLCKGCGMVFVHPAPSEQEMEQFYARSYRQSYKGTYQPKAKHVLRSGIRALERIKHLKRVGVTQGARILDIGSGGGEFIYLLKALGFRVCGLEPHQGYAKFSQEVLGVDVENDALKHFSKTAQDYDVITLHHVLEHLSDPVESMKKLQTLLKPEGLLIIEVPSILAAYHSPAKQFHLAHLHHFSPYTLEAAGQQAGFEKIRVDATPETNHILMVFKKASCLTAAADFKNAENYERVRRKLKNHTALAHYFSIYPYARPLSHLAQYFSEAFQVRGQKDAKAILNKLVPQTF